MVFTTLLYEKKGPLGIVTINRPQALNALNTQAYLELYQVFEAIGKDPAVQAVVITGSGEKAFVAGTDISTMASLNPPEAKAFAEIIHKACNLIEALHKPVVAAINGYALGGGCELALCADYRIASENSRLGQPEITLGIIPGSGGTQRLPRLIGLARAKELILLASRIDAATALSWGLVDKVVPLTKLMEEAQEIAGILLHQNNSIQ
jgi:enoyl-CoA hydratase